MPSIDRYMARLVAVPLFANLMIAAMLLVLDRIRLLLDFVIANGGPVNVVWKMLAELLPEYLGLGIPIGLMLGVLLTFRRLATSSELDVMRSLGMGYGRLLRVPYMYAVGLALVNLAIVGFVQPTSRYYYERLRFELRTGALGASIKVGEFTQLSPHMTIRVESSHDEGRRLSGIFVHADSPKGDWVSVTAQHGQFLGTDDPDVILFRLSNGTLIQNRPDFNAPRVLRFAQHELPIDLPRFEEFRGRGADKQELSLIRLAIEGHDSRVTREDRVASRAAFHFRMTEVAAMFLLPMLSLALGVPPKRSSSSLGVFLSIVILITYYKINEYAEAVAGLGKINPALALWVPFAVFAALVIWMYRTIAYVPGGQPIGALERGFSKGLAAVTKRLPRRRYIRPDASAEVTA